MKTVLFLFISFHLYCNLTLQETVNLTLLYESLCPFSMDFVKDQLQPTYDKLENYLNLDLIPFGNARQQKVNGTWKFQCQHGPKECFGNKIQACALFEKIEVKFKNNFVGCVMSTTDPSLLRNARKCAYRNQMNWNRIKKCAQSKQGDEYLAFFGNYTLSMDIGYVPYILFNGVYNETMTKRAYDDLLGTVCDIMVNKPQECNSNITELRLIENNVYGC